NVTHDQTLADRSAGAKLPTTVQRPLGIDHLGLADRNPAHYEEDHIVPLELGGAPMDPANLQPVPLSVAEKDDGAERSLHTAVCNGSLPLADAQAQILQLKTGEG
ncbi:hypothetical protein ACIBJD_39880, partial [Kitasatospora sp. NPDC050467]